MLTFSFLPAIADHHDSHDLIESKDMALGWYETCKVGFIYLWVAKLYCLLIFQMEGFIWDITHRWNTHIGNKNIGNSKS